jgi:hypothetical protein
MAEMVQTVPAEFQCQVVAYEDFKRLEDVVKAAALLSRNRNWTRQPTLVTDDIAKLVKPKQEYVVSRLKTYDGKLYGVTWSTRNVEGYQMWLNPKLSPKRQVSTTLHELCHAMVATGTSHDESFRKLLTRVMYHWNELTDSGWDVPKFGRGLIRRYTVRRANNYLADRYGYETMQEYNIRVEDENYKALTMAYKEREALRATLRTTFGWDI